MSEIEALAETDKLKFYLRPAALEIELDAEEKQITVGVGTPVFTLRDTYTDEKLAKYRAKQKLIEILAGTESMSLEIVGNLAMSAECVVNVFGVAAEAVGIWVVRSARHSLGASGYKTTFELARRQS